MCVGIFILQPIFAQETYCRAPYRVFISPEYLFRRWNYDNGQHINQILYGVVLGVEHLKASSLFLRAIGTLNEGRSRSRLGGWYDHEYSGEANIGYSFSLNKCRRFLVTPYLGLGFFYVHETVYNFYVCNEKYWYLPLGVLFGLDINEYWNMKFRLQASVLATRYLTVDGEEVHMTLNTLWRGELPITYHCNRSFDLSLVPFYQYEPNVNYIFSDTFFTDWGRISNYGARLEMGYSF